MITIVRTDSDNRDFVELVRHLDADLAIRDGEDHAFYAQFNKIDRIKYVVLAYENETPVGCGAIKEYGPNTMEVKRMYVPPESRNRGVASKILKELEKWAGEMGCTKCVLETGKRQPEASGFTRGTGTLQSRIMGNTRARKTAYVLKSI